MNKTNFIRLLEDNYKLLDWKEQLFESDGSFFITQRNGTVLKLFNTQGDHCLVLMGEFECKLPKQLYENVSRLVKVNKEREEFMKYDEFWKGF